MTRINPIVQPAVEPLLPKRQVAEEAGPQQAPIAGDTVQIRADAAEAALSRLAMNQAKGPEVVVTRDRWENLPDAPSDAGSARDLAAQIRAMMLKRPSA